MALIAPEPKQIREAVTLRLDAGVLQQLAQYAAHLDSSQEYVVNEILRTAFARDKAFQAWRQVHADNAAERAEAAAQDTRARGTPRPRRLDARSRTARGPRPTMPVPDTDHAD